MPETNIHHPTIERLRAPASPLQEAKRAFYEIAGEVDDKYAERGIDIDKVPKNRYWMAVAEAANRRAREEYSTLDKLGAGIALELTAAIPYAIMVQQRMNMRHHPSSPEMSQAEKENNKYFLSHFNNLIRTYAEANPSITPHELNEHMNTIIAQAEISRHPEYLRRLSSEIITGAQYEIGGGQLLRAVAKTREASDEEDLRGIDYVMQYGGKGFGIDIKASVGNVVRKSHSESGKQGAAIVRGKLMLYPELTHEDFHDSFFVSEEVIARKAPIIRDIIHANVNNRALKYVQF